LALNNKELLAVTVSFLFCIITASCGYRFSGSGDLPSGVESVCIKILKNTTRETGVENIITNDIIYEFTRNKREVLTHSNKADAVLAGKIKSINIGTISHRGEYTTLERRVSVNLDLELTGRDNNVLWLGKGVSDSATYYVADDKMTTENNKHKAIEELSKRLAEKVYNSLTDNF